MSPLDERSARAALDPARPAVARLGLGRDPEDNAADIIDGWSAVETALRSLLGGSSLAGQALVRELRQRESLSITDAHKVLEFLAARERAGRVDYQPVETDLVAARDGFQAVESRLLTGAAPATTATSSYAPLATPGHASRIADVASSGGDYSSPAPVQQGGRGPGRLLGLALVGLLAVLGLGYYFMQRGGSTNDELDKGIALYRSGNRVTARDHFQAAAAQNPRDPRPLVYLARVNRELGDMTSATTELTSALTVEPDYALALREMGVLQLARGNPSLARNFFVHAIQSDSSDRESKGLLACALARLGTVQSNQLADTWAQRAGPGAWSTCIAAARGQLPPPGATPMGQPANPYGAARPAAPAGQYAQPVH